MLTKKALKKSVNVLTKTIHQQQLVQYGTMGITLGLCIRNICKLHSVEKQILENNEEIADAINEVSLNISSLSGIVNQIAKN